MTALKMLKDIFNPIHYDLSLDVRGPERTFTGTVKVYGNLIAATDTIVLHAKELDIKSATINGAPARLKTSDFDELHIQQPNLKSGKHEIVIKFDGKITNSMHGLYPCHYNFKNQPKELFATQFESHHAREVFPCIDEPAAKATFSLQLQTEPDQIVLSNMPSLEQKIRDNRLLTVFDKTPRMSTYLLAFVIGDLHRKTTTTKSGIEINVWSTIAQPSENLDFGLKCAKDIIEFYEDFFGTPYPLPKCDHVALPDFSSGAMENWGLITYREIALLANTSHSSIEHRQHVALVIAHELAHQWFGNLVTMEWWNDLWLNESFANMMEYLSIDAIYPNWAIWLKFSSNEALAALRRDSIDGVQAVQVKIDHPDQIDTLFDPAIVYAKGGRLLRMVQHYIGDSAFKEGLKDYFSMHAYQNTIGDDLWNSLEKASGKKISFMMNKWISQPGYPVIHVERQNNEISFSQNQFFIGPHKDKKRVWPVPIDANLAEAPKLLDKPSVRINSTAPVRLNQFDSAHFITNYDELSRKILLDNIKHGAIDTLGRLQFLHESTLLARAGILPSDELIPLIQSFKNEDHEAVWGIIAIALADLRKFVDKDSIAEHKLKLLSEWVARTQYKSLGWRPQPNESENSTKKRGTIIGLTLYGEKADAIRIAKHIYSSTNPEDIDPEIRDLIFSTVAKYDKDTKVDELLDVYKKSDSSELRHDICIGVTSTKNPEKISMLLNSIRDPSIVKAQDIYLWFALLIRGRESRTLAWNWLRNNWSWIEKTFDGDKSFDDFPRYVASSLSTRQELAEFRTFFEPKRKITALKRVIDVGISEIQGKVEIIERDSSSVRNSLIKLKID